MHRNAGIYRNAIFNLTIFATFNLPFASWFPITKMESLLGLTKNTTIIYLAYDLNTAVFKPFQMFSHHIYPSFEFYGVSGDFLDMFCLLHY